MKKMMGFILLLAAGIPAQFDGQIAPSSISSATPAGKRQKAGAEKPDKSSPNKLFGNPLQSTEPTTTEIYADEAFFDSTKNMGIFSGRVKVTDPRFNLQSDKLTVFITKGQNQGLERAIAEGSVGLVRDRPDPNGGPPTRAIGRADKAIYNAATGDIELRGTPRVQEGPNMHVATSPDTVMIINQNSQLTTHGPSRTEIRQQPKEETKGGTKTGATPAQVVPAPPLPKP
jgi:lipopolysaccharide transport protein LptA